MKVPYVLKIINTNTQREIIVKGRLEQHTLRPLADHIIKLYKFTKYRAVQYVYDTDTKKFEWVKLPPSDLSHTPLGYHRTQFGDKRQPK